jgi:flagellar biosynthesis protein FlhB
MADDASLDDYTRKEYDEELRREEGIVPYSYATAHYVGLIGALAVGVGMQAKLTQPLQSALALLSVQPANVQALYETGFILFRASVGFLLMIAGTFFFCAFLTGLIQTKFLLRMQVLGFNAARINPFKHTPKAACAVSYLIKMGCAAVGLSLLFYFLFRFMIVSGGVLFALSPSALLQTLQDAAWQYFIAVLFACILLAPLFWVLTKVLFSIRHRTPHVKYGSGDS